MSTVSFRLFPRTIFWIGDDVVRILGLAIVLTLLYVEAPVTELLSDTLLGDPPDPDGFVPTNFS